MHANEWANKGEIRIYLLYLYVYLAVTRKNELCSEYLDIVYRGRMESAQQIWAMTFPATRKQIDEKMGKIAKEYEESGL